MSGLEVSCACENEHSLCWCQNATSCCRSWALLQFGTLTIIPWLGWGGSGGDRVEPSSSGHPPPWAFSLSPVACPCLLLGEILVLHKTEKDAFSMVRSEIVHFLRVVLEPRSWGGGWPGRSGQAATKRPPSVLGMCSVLQIWWSWFIFRTRKTEVWESQQFAQAHLANKGTMRSQVRSGGFQILFYYIPICRLRCFRKSNSSNCKYVANKWKVTNCSLDRRLLCFMKLVAVGFFKTAVSPSTFKMNYVSINYHNWVTCVEMWKILIMVTN